MKPWKILKSRVSYEDSWLKVRSDTVELADGSILDTYHVVEAPDWVKVIALTNHDTIVLIEQYRHPVAHVQLELPGGIIEKDEPAEVAAQRELLEETGYGNGRLFNLGTLNALAGRFTSQIHTFLALGVEKLAAPSLDTSESIGPLELSWSDFVDRLPLRDANDMASLMLLSLFAAQSTVPSIRQLKFATS
jgi:ADP-ribose pyrophosphatase